MACSGLLYRGPGPQSEASWRAVTGTPLGVGQTDVKQCLRDEGKMSVKDDYAELVAKKTGCTKTAARKAVDEIFEQIMKTTKRTGEVQIPGFGKFRVQKRAARMGRNPRTGQSMRIGPSKSVGFRPAAAFKGSL